MRTLPAASTDRNEGRLELVNRAKLYATGLDALIDGWRLLQMSQLLPHQPGHEYDVSYLPYEFLFERLVDITA